jgi:hypothetical protein
MTEQFFDAPLDASHSRSTPLRGDDVRRGRAGWIVAACAVLAVLVAPSSVGAALPPPKGPIYSVPEVSGLPPAPKPEPVKITELPMPPAAPSDAAGACTTAVNPHGTGCMDAGPSAIQSGSFVPNGKAIVAMITYAGASSAPNPASMYSGPQMVLIKTNGSKFSDGDAFRCLTCGMPADHAIGVSSDLSYPQPFRDGKRLLAGPNIFDCSPYPLTSPKCTGAVMREYPIYWQTTADGSGKSGNLRELRLNPDQVHIGFNHIVFSPVLGEFGYLGRLKFDPDPTTGIPTAPRYDLTKVTTLYSGKASAQVWTQDASNTSQIDFHPLAPSVGEFRGFTKDGKWALYIGNPTESDNIDLFATNLTTGKTMRLTRNPGYVDPIDISPNNKWEVVMDTRSTDRMSYLSAMGGVPPLTDMVTAGIVSSVRNNGARRFFQPYLIDISGDRWNYQGQQLNAGSGKSGSLSDPNWNGEADPRWSPDGTQIVYWQNLVAPPACVGSNPLPCPKSTEPGGRETRIMLATLTSRQPEPSKPVKPISDVVPWGTPYSPGDTIPARAHLPAGNYTLKGTVSGVAQVQIGVDSTSDSVDSVLVTYSNFSDDGFHTINGTESVAGSGGVTLHTVFHENLKLSGKQTGTKVTSEPGGYDLTIDAVNNIIMSNGSLTTTINGRTYSNPAPGG